MNIGRKIKQIRELKNYTQEFMANSLGLSQAGYGKIERDMTDLSINRLQQIANVLEVDFKQILDEEDKNVFNMYNNNTANAVVHNQQYINDARLFELIENIQNDLKILKSKFKE